MSAAVEDKVWVADEKDGYVLADIVEQDTGDGVLVRVLGHEKRLDVDEVFDVNPARYDNVEDMAEMGFLSDATVLHNLRTRFMSDRIYTYSGLFCVVVNPYKLLPIYTPEVVDQYKGKRRGEIAPHVFTVADEAYRTMVDERQNQSLLITGESGAGKTVNTKKVIQYLAAIAGRVSSDGGRGELEEQIVQANPILEAFGNAKTIRNNNSSRFGKFIEVQFTSNGVIAGAEIDVYLLEKSRVVFQSGAERNYHVFYQLLVGAPQAMRDELHLTRLEDYRWINQAPGSFVADEVDDTIWFEEMQEAWVTMGIPAEEVMQVYRVMSAVLHMGNVQFAANRDESAKVDDAGTAELNTVEELLGLAPGSLVKSVLRPRLKAGMEWVNKKRTAAQAQNVMEALAKSIYERTFRWIVQRINETLANDNRTELFIGVLDISGFEIFEVNSFEQLCINYTNECLQQFFNNHMFKLEQEEYLREQIEWDMIDFGLDLQPTIDLIEQTSAPIGILAILDEQCSFPKSTDETFVEKLTEIHAVARGETSKFSVPKFSRNQFSVAHYAGSVDYTCDDWLEKNRDKLDDPVAVVMQDSAHPYISALFDDLTPPREGQASKARGKNKKSRPYITQAHKKQLFELMSTLRSTTPHFIRCIKPNEEKRAGLIDAHMVLDQLACNGVLEGIRICRKGFPNRMAFADFRSRYKVLAGGAAPDSLLDAKVACQRIIEAVGMDASQFRLGVTKVFLKAGRLPELESLRDEILGQLLVKFQAVVRGHFARARLEGRLGNSKAVAVLQKAIRIYFNLRHWGWYRLFNKIRPMIDHKSMEEEVQAREAQLKALQAEKEAAAAAKAEMEANLERLEKEREAEAARLEEERRRDAESAEAERERLRLEAEQRMRDAEKAIADATHKSEEEQQRLREKLAKEKRELERQQEEQRLALEAQMADEKRRLEEEKEREKARLEAEAAKQRDELERKRKDYEAQVRKRDQQLAAERSSRQEEEDKRRRLADQKTSLESRLTALQDDLEDEQDARSKAESQARQLQSEISRLQSQISELESSSQSLESAQRDTEARLTATATELASVQDQLTRVESSKRAATNELAELHDEVADLERRLQSSERDRKKAEKGVTEAQRNAQDAEARIADAERKARKLQSELKRAKSAPATEGSSPGADAAVRRLEAQLRALREQLATAEARIQSLDRQRRSAAASNDELQESLDDAEAALATAKRATATAQEQAADALEQADEERDAREQSELLLHQRMLELDDLRRQLATASDESATAMSSASARWQQALDAVNEELEAEVRARTRAEKALRQAKAEHDAAVRDAQAAAARNASGGAAEQRLRAELAAVQTQLSEAEANRTRAVASLDTLKANQETLRNEAEAAIRAAGQAKKKAKSFEMEVEDLREQVEEAEQLQGAAATHVRELESDLREAQALAEDESARADALQDEQNHLLEEIEMMRAAVDTEAAARIEELERMVRALNNQILELNEDVDEATRKTAAAERGRRAALTQRDDAEDQIASLALNAQLAVEAKQAIDADLKQTRAQLRVEQEALMQAELRQKRIDAAQAETAAAMSELQARADAAVAARKQLQSKLRDTQSLVDDKQHIIDNVERSKRLQAEELEQLKEELEDALEAKAGVEALRRKQYAELQEVRNELETQVEGKVQAMDAERRSALREAEDLRIRVAELEGSAGRGSRGTGGRSGDYKALQSKLLESQAKTRTQTKLAKRLKADLAKAKTSEAQTAKQRDSAKRDAQVAKTQLAESSARFDVLEKSKASLSSSVRSLQAQVEDLRDALETANSTKQQQVERRRAAEQEVMELRQAAELGTGNQEALDEQKRQHMLEVAEVRKQMTADFNVDIEALENSKRQIREKLDTVKEMLDECEREKATMELQLEQAQRDAASAKTKLTDEVNSRAELEKDNRAMNSELKDLRHRLQVAESLQASAREEKATLQDRINALMGKNEQLSAQTVELDTEAKRAKSELEAMRDDYADAVAAAAAADEQIRLIAAEMEELRDRLTEEEEQRDEWMQEKLEREDELAELKHTYETEIEERVEQMEESRRALLRETKQITERCEREEEQKIELEKANRALVHKAEDLEDICNTLQMKQTEHARVVNKLQSELTVAQSRLEGETKGRLEAEMSCKRLELTLKDANDEMTDLTRQLESMRNKRAAAEDRAQANHLELEEERAAFAALNETCIALESEHDDLRDKTDELESHLRTLEEAAVATEKNADMLHAELAKLDDANAALEKECVAKDRELSDLRSRLSRAEGSDRSATERVKQRLNAKVADLTARLSTETSAKLEQQKLNRQLAKDVRKVQAEVKEAQKSRDRSDRTLKKALARVEQLRAELEEQSAELALVDGQRRKLQRECSDLKERSVNDRAENAAMKEQLADMARKQSERERQIAALTGLA